MVYISYAVLLFAPMFFSKWIFGKGEVEGSFIAKASILRNPANYIIPMPLCQAVM